MWYNDFCLSWDETTDWFKLLGIETVPVIYDGPFNIDVLKGLYKPLYNDCEMEGFVVRTAQGFKLKDFDKVVAKYVRKDHIKTTQHWKKGLLTKNSLLGE
jgi:hypothetical protein